MDRLPFSRRVPLLNMTLGAQEDECAARWLAQPPARYPAADAAGRLHRQISSLWQVPYAASFMGGRASLYAVIRTLGLNPGDQVLIPAFTCQCVTNALTFNGVEARFVDIETDTYGMDAQAMAAAITPRTKAVLIQYTFGLVCRDLPQLLATAREHGLLIVEDCAHATGGRWRGQLLGTLGDIAFFSSERSKIVNTIHGGWVITADTRLGERLQEVYLRSHEADPVFVTRLLHTLRHACAELRDPAAARPEAWLPQMQPAELSGLFSPQYGWRMAEPVAELLSLQLARLPALLEPRRKGAEFWQAWTQARGIRGPRPRSDAENTWLRYPLLLTPEQKTAREALERELNAETGVWFTTPMHPHPLELPDCPAGMRAARGCVNLPTWLWETR